MRDYTENMIKAFITINKSSMYGQRSFEGHYVRYIESLHF